MAADVFTSRFTRLGTRSPSSLRANDRQHLLTITSDAEYSLVVDIEASAPSTMYPMKKCCTHYDITGEHSKLTIRR
jgi:hypothetical protein